MAPTVNLLPILPDKIASTESTEAEMRSRGWKVENGKVSVPALQLEQQPLNKALASLLGSHGLQWISNMTDAVASSYVATTHANFESQWNNYQLDTQKMLEESYASGDFTNVPGNIRQSYGKFKEDIRKQYGDVAYSVLKDAMAKTDKYVLSELYLAQTQTAKASAAAKLAEIEENTMLKVRGNPSNLPIVLQDLDRQLFQVGNITQADAQKQYATTAKSLIENGLAKATMDDPEAALDILKSVEMHLAPVDYAKYKKRIDIALRQKQRSNKAQLDNKDAVQRVIAAADTEEAVNLTAQLKRDADTLEMAWGTTYDPGDGVRKDDIYAKIGYVPKLYSTRLHHAMLYGSEEQRTQAATSVAVLSSKLPPWGGDLQRDLVDLAFAYNEISHINPEHGKMMVDNFNKLASMKADERNEIRKTTISAINQKDRDSKLDSVEMARKDIFRKPGFFFEGEFEAEEFHESLTVAELNNFDKEFIDTTCNYTALGFSVTSAEQMATERLRTKWGTSTGISGKPYPTYSPIEQALGLQPKEKKRFEEYTKKAIFSFARPNLEKPPEPKDVRLIWSGGEGHNALYDVIYYDKTYDKWLPYVVMIDDEEQQLTISSQKLANALKLERAG